MPATLFFVIYRPGYDSIPGCPTVHRVRVLATAGDCRWGRVRSGPSGVGRSGAARRLPGPRRAGTGAADHQPSRQLRPQRAMFIEPNIGGARPTDGPDRPSHCVQVGALTSKVPKLRTANDAPAQRGTRSRCHACLRRPRMAGTRLRTCEALARGVSRVFEQASHGRDQAANLRSEALARGVTLVAAKLVCARAPARCGPKPAGLMRAESRSRMSVLQFRVRLCLAAALFSGCLHSSYSEGYVARVTDTKALAGRREP